MGRIQPLRSHWVGSRRKSVCRRCAIEKGELGYDIVKRAVGNLVNRYRAVLKKCHLMNMFGSLAVAGLLVAGSAVSATANKTAATAIAGDGKRLLWTRALSMGVSLGGSAAEGNSAVINGNTSLFTFTGGMLNGEILAVALPPGGGEPCLSDGGVLRPSISRAALLSRWRKDVQADHGRIYIRVRAVP